MAVGVTVGWKLLEFEAMAQKLAIKLSFWISGHFLMGADGQIDCYRIGNASWTDKICIFLAFWSHDWTEARA